MDLKGYNQTQTAELVGCSIAYVNQILHGERVELGLEFAVAFANALDVSIFDLATTLKANPYLAVVGELESGDIGIEDYVKDQRKQQLLRIPKPPWLTDKNSLAVRVRGSEFRGRLQDGDVIILVKITKSLRDGARVAVKLKSGNILYKEYWRDGEKITLQSLHGGPPTSVGAGDIDSLYRLATIIPAE